MKENPAVSAEALLNKARVYVFRALQARAIGDHDAYQLWSALSLELLGKASLAAIHPTLVAEPKGNPNILLEANGIETNTPMVTIDVSTLFARLKHTVRNFGTPIAEASKKLVGRRNAELHSGTAAFVGMDLEAWEGDFWSATQLILDSMRLDLDGWLGPSAQQAKELVGHLQEVKERGTLQRITHAAKMFAEKRSRAEQDAARVASQSFLGEHYRDRFRYPKSYIWDHDCPACECKGFLTGDWVGSEADEDQSEADPGYEMVVDLYAPIEFFCPTCELHLLGIDVLNFANMAEFREMRAEREIDYEPDYGND